MIDFGNRDGLTLAQMVNMLPDDDSVARGITKRPIQHKPKTGPDKRHRETRERAKRKEVNQFASSSK